MQCSSVQCSSVQCSSAIDMVQAPQSRKVFCANCRFIQQRKHSVLWPCCVPTSSYFNNMVHHRSTRVLVLGDVRPGEEAAVTALAFNGQGGMLLAGHANGNVVLWEWHRTAWDPVKSIRGEAAGGCLYLPRLHVGHFSRASEVTYIWPALACEHTPESVSASVLQ